MDETIHPNHRQHPQLPPDQRVKPQPLWPTVIALIVVFAAFFEHVLDPFAEYHGHGVTLCIMLISIAVLYLDGVFG